MIKRLVNRLCVSYTYYDEPVTKSNILKSKKIFDIVGDKFTTNIGKINDVDDFKAVLKFCENYGITLYNYNVHVFVTTIHNEYLNRIKKIDELSNK